MVDTAVSIPLAQSTENLQRSLSLRAFYAGPENPLADQAFKSFAAKHGRFNPLAICGPSDVGKSQFARCVAGRWKHLNPDKPCIEMSCAEFAEQYRASFRDDKLHEFRMAFQEIGLFVLEDLHDLASKPATQRELLVLFDKMWHSGVLMLFTLHAAPATIKGILPALTSRLAMGLIVPLAKPGLAARRAMLQDIIANSPTRMSPNAVNVLARETHLSASDMLATVKSLLATGGFVDQKEARRSIRLQTDSIAVSPARILRSVASYFRVHVKTLKSASRNRQAVTARGVAIYLMRQLTAESLEKIGKHLGNRDHTTILHQVRKIERLSQTEPEIKTAITTIQRQLT